MGKILSPRLVVDKKDNSTVTLRLDYTIDFDESEIRNKYSIHVVIEGRDPMPPINTIFMDHVEDLIVATSKPTKRCDFFTFTRDQLNEDKSGKDELIATIRVQPIGTSFSVKTNEIQRKF